MPVTEREPNTAMRRPRPRRVLVVDDDADMRRLLEDALEREGFAVTVAEKGADVIGAVESSTFDAVVVDKDMPGINGLDLVVFLQHRSPGTPAVLMTAFGGPLAAEAALRRGAAAYLDKPVRIPDLVATLEDVMTRGRHTAATSWTAAASTRDAAAPIPSAPGTLWAIVLAGGRGARLRALTRRIHGEPRPKQYAKLVGDRSMLRHTLDRVALRIPADRTFVVSMRGQWKYLEGELAGSAPPRVVLQPRDRGTAAATLLAAYAVHWRDPDAVVALFPSDHFIPEASLFMDRVSEAALFANRDPRWIVLLGAPAMEPETEYGWIEPGEMLGCTRMGPVWRVRRFVEKPSAPMARALLTDGGLWNTLVLVAKASTLKETGRQLLSGLHTHLVAAAPLVGTPAERGALRRAYAAVPDADFSGAILEQCPSILAVAPLTGVSWCDFGSPRRIMRAARQGDVPLPWAGGSTGPRDHNKEESS